MVRDASFQNSPTILSEDVSALGPCQVPGTRRFASMKYSSRSKAPQAPEPAKLPRFLRRQTLQKKAAEENPAPENSSVKTWSRSDKTASGNRGETKSSTPSTTYRSRHYDRSTETPKSEMRLLEPHVLSERLKKLCDAGKVDDAVVMLKNAPLDAQNTPVWNTLIWEALKISRYQLAYQLFIDMKRRGFGPTSRTYQTFFNGLARIEEWSTFPKQLTNARSLYDGFKRHIEFVKRADPQDPELTPNPLAGYIRILGNAGEYQEIFDVYYAMDQDGPMAPNQLVWTALFQAIANAKSDTVEGSVKVAADARLLWNQMTKAAKRNPKLAPDSYTVSAALFALSGGNQMDADLAFKIIAEYYGLQAGSTVSKPGILTLGPEALNNILKLCNRTKNHEHAIQFLQQVKRRPKDIGGVDILDRMHMEEIFRADLALNVPGLGYHAVDTLEWMLRQEITSANGPKIRPALSTYNLVMQACWRSGDWSSAVRTFELMTGYHAHDFIDGAVAAVPRLDKRGPGRNLPPNAEIMSSMVRTALAGKNRADMRQVLRIVDYFGLDKLLHFKGAMAQNETMKAVKHRALFGKKLATAILETLDYIMQDNGKYAKPHEVGKWRELARQAKSINWDGGMVDAPAQKEVKTSNKYKTNSEYPRKRQSTRT
ncbi:pentatricopeptide repeat-containing protein [Pholiota molesta]|nr:pentatricopeptide repeat-containing protein [Pholiota molesta]